jgi:RIO kinase 1
MPFDYEKFARRFLKEERMQRPERKIEKLVFDETVGNTIWQLAKRGEIDQLLGVVSTGKEAHVFKALAPDGSARAVKIYKFETSSFQQMWDYIEGDPRFGRVRKQLRPLVVAWCRKEFKNLSLAHAAGAHVPEPFIAKNNVLVMQFIGDSDAAPLIKDIDLPDSDSRAAFASIAEDMRKLYRAGFVHSDLSEFNIMYWRNRPWLIDIAQGVALAHPRSREFLERDVRNVMRFFWKHGVEETEDGLMKRITA